MIIDRETMEKLHEIQYEMFLEIKRVMEELNVKYYFVHGSLLGAVRDRDFIIEDDDIDIALMRKDYDILIENGNRLIKPPFYLQSSINDEYPLAFAKVRHEDTAFIQPELSGYNCSKGIYIDIFPIDYSPRNWRLFDIRKTLIDTRINAQSKQIKRSGIKYKAARLISKICYPSLSRALKSREKLMKTQRVSNLVSIHGGKQTEKDMPLKWFEKTTIREFHNTEVCCPIEYEEYLTRIYGEKFFEHNPANQRMVGSGIEVSASIIDFNKSYKIYDE